MNWWQPTAVLEQHGRFIIVRDDLVPGGAKTRFLPYLLGDAKEIVYGTPFCGGAQFALSEWGRRTGAKITLFAAKRKILHRRQIAAIRNGATLYQVPFGYMTNVQAKARAYAADHGALFLPLGFDLPEARAPFIQQIKEVAAMVGPVDQVWAATGSGMLARCLGEAFAPIPVFGVAVGLSSRHEKQAFSSNVTLIQAPYDFAQECRQQAPFPACANYERKAWEICEKQSKGRVLFWNVLA